VQKSKIKNEGDTEVVHLMGVRLYDRSADLELLSEDHQAEIELSRADVFAHGQPPSPSQGMWRHPRNVRVLPKSRDFH